MAVVIAKKPVVAAPPVAKPVPPAAQNYAPPAPAPVAGAPVVEDDDADEKPARMTRKDFATHEEFCDYKIAFYRAMVERTNAKITLWEQKKVNKDADVAEKKQKKADKLIAAWINIQRQLGMSEEEIAQKVELFKAKV